MIVHSLLPFTLLACAPEAEVPLDPGVEVWSRGEDRGRGNLLGLQPRVTPQDYATAEAFEGALRPLFEGAEIAGMLRRDTVVVLPEMVGAWLVAQGEAPAVLDAATVDEAMAQAVLANLDAWLDASAGAPAADPDTYGVFAMKADVVAATYQDVLSALASGFRVTVVGGSVLLPDPVVVDGAIVPTPHGVLRNASFVFGPDGALLGAPVIKAFPTADEQPFVGAGAVEDLPVFDTPAGRLGVLVCADSWFPEAYAHLAGRVDLVAVPVFGAGDGSWSVPWQGYSGWNEPADVDPADVGALTEGEAWAQYSLPGRLDESGAAAGITVPLRGSLWDLGSDGRPFAVRADASHEAPFVDEPLLVNLWL